MCNEIWRRIYLRVLLISFAARLVSAINEHEVKWIMERGSETWVHSCRQCAWCSESLGRYVSEVYTWRRYEPKTLKRVLTPSVKQTDTRRFWCRRCRNGSQSDGCAHVGSRHQFVSLLEWTTDAREVTGLQLVHVLRKDVIASADVTWRRVTWEVNLENDIGSGRGLLHRFSHGRTYENTKYVNQNSPNPCWVLKWKQAELIAVLTCSVLALEQIKCKLMENWSGIENISQRNWVIPQSRVLLEKLTVTQLVKKFPAFYGTRRFITVFTGPF